MCIELCSVIWCLTSRGQYERNDVFHKSFVVYHVLLNSSETLIFSHFACQIISPETGKKVYKSQRYLSDQKRTGNAAVEFFFYINSQSTCFAIVECEMVGTLYTSGSQQETPAGFQKGLNITNNLKKNYMSTEIC